MSAQFIMLMKTFLFKVVWFLAELSLLFKWKYIWGWSLMWTTCRWRVDDTRVRFWVRFHRQMTYVIWTSCARHLDTCLSCPISWSTTPGVILMSSAHHPQTHMLSAHHLHVICTHMSSTCHLHVICTLPWVAQFPAVLCLVSSACHLQTHMSSACHLHIICRYIHHLHSPHGPHCISCAKDTSYWCDCSSDVVPDLALLKTYCLHIIRGSLHCPYGPQLCFLSQKY